jgi:large subunit ribosomal protein L24e
MVDTKKCTFCGFEIEPGTGKMYVKRDGAVYSFCSNKCKKNMMVLGRTNRRVKWTKAYEKTSKKEMSEKKTKKKMVKKKATKPDGEKAEEKKEVAKKEEKAADEAKNDKKKSKPAKKLKPAKKKKAAKKSEDKTEE